MRVAASLVLAGLLLLPEAAWAHGVVAGSEGFYAGMLHPLAVPAHVLMLLGLGLLFGQSSWRPDGALIAFALALLTGLFVAGTHLAPPLPAPALLTMAALAGLLVAVSISSPPAGGIVLAVATGAAIGLDSSPDTPLGRGWASALAGTWLGASLLLILVAGAAREPRQAWHRIGVRVLGSWTAASALLVLALAVKR
jgi:hydrogenase/urease accessory protein HupE